jgi:hypothetical protein
MFICGITVLILLFLAWPGWSKDVLLFAIQRNKNANEVQYHLRVNERCHLAAHTPVSAVWKLWAEHPEKTEPLTDLEQMAYGAVKQRVTENWVSFDLGFLDHFRALEQRSVNATARYESDTATCLTIVHTTINGQASALKRIYVHAEEGMVKPKVLYIDLFGTSLDAPRRPVQERITP